MPARAFQVVLALLRAGANVDYQNKVPLHNLKAYSSVIPYIQVTGCVVVPGRAGGIGGWVGGWVSACVQACVYSS